MNRDFFGSAIGQPQPQGGGAPAPQQQTQPQGSFDGHRLTPQNGQRGHGGYNDGDNDVNIGIQPHRGGGTPPPQSAPAPAAAPRPQWEAQGEMSGVPRAGFAPRASSQDPGTPPLTYHQPPPRNQGGYSPGNLPPLPGPGSVEPTRGAISELPPLVNPTGSGSSGSIPTAHFEPHPQTPVTQGPPPGEVSTEPLYRIFSPEFLENFVNTPANPNIKAKLASVEEFNGLLHPCLKHRGSACRESAERAKNCPLRDLPKEVCLQCITGEPHTAHTGVEPERHPCIRVWGKCKYGDQCVFRGYPRDWCLFCLRKANHSKCSGIRPSSMPSIPKDVTEQCAEHERRLATDQLSTPPDSRSSSRASSPAPHPRHNLDPNQIHAPMIGGEPSPYALQSPQGAFSAVSTTEAAYRAPKPFGKQKTPFEKFLNGVNSILNKMSPERYTSLSQQLLELVSNNLRFINDPMDQPTDVEAGIAETAPNVLMEEVAQKLFHKAISELNYIKMYAELSNGLEVSLKEMDGYPFNSERFPNLRMQPGTTLGLAASNWYRKKILQLSYNQFHDTGPKDDIDADDGVTRSEEEELAIKKHRDRSLANTRFVGALYIHGRVSVKIIDDITKKLLYDHSDRPAGPRCEIFMSLLRVCGKCLEEKKDPKVVSSWCQRLAKFKAPVKMLVGDEVVLKDQISTRVSFLIDNFLEFRRNGWEESEREVASQPMTLNECQDLYWKGKDGGSSTSGGRSRTNSPIPQLGGNVVPVGGLEIQGIPTASLRPSNSGRITPPSGGGGSGKWQAAGRSTPPPGGVAGGQPPAWGRGT